MTDEFPTFTYKSAVATAAFGAGCACIGTYFSYVSFVSVRAALSVNAANRDRLDQLDHEFKELQRKFETIASRFTKMTTVEDSPVNASFWKNKITL
jgi:hypothetical protein